MNNAQVLAAIAEFSQYGDSVVIKQDDWNTLVNWVENLPKDITVDRPNFDILPVMFSKSDR